MDKLADILDVAGGNRPLSVTMEPQTMVLLGFVLFIAMLLALFVAGFILT